MGLRTKITLYLFFVFALVAFLVVSLEIKRLKSGELRRLIDENSKIVEVLTRDLLGNLKSWQLSQAIEGPYGFGKTDIKKSQENFVSRYQEITSREVVLFNIYNEKNVIIASNKKEQEGIKIENPEIKEVIQKRNSASKIVGAEEIHLLNPDAKKTLAEKTILEIYSPIIIDGDGVGAIEAYFVSNINIGRRIAEITFTAAGTMLFVLLVIYLFFEKMILRPLDAIRQATRPVGQGVFSGFIKNVRKNDEIGQLAEDFNLMIKGLNSLSGEIMRLKEIARLKSEFISITAHQLRTPLSGIKWVLELALEKETSAELKNWLLKIDELNERMIENINDLLNAARIEEGRFGYKFQEKINLVSFLDKIADVYQIKIKEKKLDFSFSRGEIKNLYLKADPEKLEIAFDNLIENAIDYTREGGTVRVELEKPNGFVIIKIKDTGIGIAKEDLPRLFSKFFRGQNAISAQPNGSGIGLFIAKNIIEAHRGEIWPESELNQGTTFYVKLPLVETKKEELEKSFKKV